MLYEVITILHPPHHDDAGQGDECVFDALPGLRQARPQLPVIVMSAQSNVTTALSAAVV